MADPERHKELVRRWFEDGVASNDPETARRVADEVFAEDYQDGDSPGAPQDRETFKRMITERMYAAFGDVEAKVEHTLAEGDMAAAYVRISMTHIEQALGPARDGQARHVHGGDDQPHGRRPHQVVARQVGLARRAAAARHRARAPRERSPGHRRLTRVDAFSIRPAEEGDRRPLALLFAAVAEERDGIAAEPPIDLEQRAATWHLDGTFVAVAAGEIVGNLQSRRAGSVSASSG